MKTTKFIFNTLVMSFAISSFSTAFAEKIEIDGIAYEIKSDGTAAISYKGNDEDAWIWTDAMDLYTGDLIIPSEIEYSGKVYTVTELGNGVFAGCKYLTSLFIPSTITKTGTDLFSGCNSLEAFYVDDENPEFFSYEGVMYRKNPTKIFYVPRNICDNVTLHEELTEIKTSAFQSNSNLTTITIPSNVTKICDGAFFGCKSLEEVNFNNSLESIELKAFSECSNLAMLYFPESVKRIGDNAFSGCKNLSMVIFKDGLESIGQYAFYNCPNISAVHLTKNLKTIGNNAFKECVNLKTIKNDSNLPIVLGSTSYGYVAYYATEILKDEQSSIGTMESSKEMSYYKNGDKWFVTNASGKWISIYSMNGQIIGQHFCATDAEEIPFEGKSLIIVVENK